MFRMNFCNVTVVITPVRGSSEKGQNKTKQELLGLSQDKASCPPGPVAAWTLCARAGPQDKGLPRLLGRILCLQPSRKEKSSHPGWAWHQRACLPVIGGLTEKAQLEPKGGKGQQKRSSLRDRLHLCGETSRSEEGNRK